MAGGIFALFIVWMVVFGSIGGAIWQSKGESFGLGFLMGAALGVIGIILAAVLSPGGTVTVGGSFSQSAVAVRHRDPLLEFRVEKTPGGWAVFRGRTRIYECNDREGVDPAAAVHRVELERVALGVQLRSFVAGNRQDVASAPPSPRRRIT